MNIMAMMLLTTTLINQPMINSTETNAIDIASLEADIIKEMSDISKEQNEIELKIINDSRKQIESLSKESKEFTKIWIIIIKMIKSSFARGFFLWTILKNKRKELKK